MRLLDALHDEPRLLVPDLTGSAEQIRREALASQELCVFVTERPRRQRMEGCKIDGGRVDRRAGREDAAPFWVLTEILEDVRQRAPPEVHAGDEDLFRVV